MIIYLQMLESDDTKCALLLREIVIKTARIIAKLILFSTIMSGIL